MRVTGKRVGLCVVLLLMALSCRASVPFPANPEMPFPEKFVVATHIDDAMVMRQSLRRDVTSHPDDFIVFATEAGAKQFFADHYEDGERETDPRMVARGVMGYWQGKTVVVLPWIALSKF